MNSERSSNWVVISGFILAITIMASWGIDIAVSALSNEGGILTNGFFLSNPLKIYHICLYMIILLSFSHFLITVHIILRHRQDELIDQTPVIDESEDGFTNPGDIYP